MSRELLKGLFTEPFDRERWLKDQQTLIDRMKKKRSKFIKEQREKLESFQKDDQCSVLMIDIMKERLENYELKSYKKELDK